MVETCITMSMHYFVVNSDSRPYTFAYDDNSRSLCMVQWPNGEKAMRIIAAGLPQTFDHAHFVAKDYVKYIDCDYQSC